MSEPTPWTTGRIVLLNGPPSVGKSALARALQSILDDPYFHRSLDDFRQGYPARFWQSDDGTLFRRTLDGYLRTLRALAESGHNVIAEAVVTPERLEDYLSLFAELPVLFVGVRCPLAEAQRRERARRDRARGPIELEASAFERVHAHG
ncbi:MAG: phosphotransferase-like protein, partial [Dehalococcoidia bacterium]